MPRNTMLIYGFALFMAITASIEDRLSFDSIPSEFRQGWYATFLGVTLSWGCDLMLNQDWVDFILMLFIAVLLFAGLLIAIQKGHKRDDKERDYKLGIFSEQISKDIKDAVKEGVKEGIKEGLNEYRQEKQADTTTQKK